MFRNIFSCGTKYVRRYTIKSLQKFEILSSKEEKDDIFSKLILSNTGKSVQEWKTLREDILNTSQQVTTKSIDSMILNFCINNKHYEQAKHYIDYMKKENIKLNLATVGKYFKLHYALYLEKLSTEEDEHNILELYRNLTKEYPILDSITNEHIILGLSVTKEWKECFKLFNNVKISCIPNTLSYNAIICAAFSHNDYDTGWNLFQEMIEKNRRPLSVTYLTYLDQIERNDYKTKCLKLDDLFEFLAANDLEFNEDIANNILKITSDRSKITFITKNGVCKICNKKLQSLELSGIEFNQLKNAFFDNVIVGRDVFCKTTPEELERFKHFVKNMDKFDVVVDGLNVAYSAGSKQSPHICAMLLAAVVRHFIDQGKKVLVLGRSHMERLPKQNWYFVKRYATIFLTENISQDDPYILYCALQCGPSTIIVTRDLMRSHLYLLKDRQNKLLFNRWLTQSRYHLLNATPDKTVFKMPLPYMITSQKDENYWHVPYIVGTNNVTKAPIYKWLCINT